MKIFTIAFILFFSILSNALALSCKVDANDRLLKGSLKERGIIFWGKVTSSPMTEDAVVTFAKINVLYAGPLVDDPTCKKCILPHGFNVLMAAANFPYIIFNVGKYYLVFATAVKNSLVIDYCNSLTQVLTSPNDPKIEETRKMLKEKYHYDIR